MFQLEQQDNVRDAFRLFLNAQVAFADMEANGLKVDTNYLNKTIIDTERRIAELETNMLQSEVGRRWVLMFKGNMSFSKRQQLAVVLFNNIKDPHPDNMGLECTSWTESGLPQTSEQSLEKFPEVKDFIKDYILWASLNKMLKVYLFGIRDAMDPYGYVHSTFSLFSVVSYRTSSSNPNVQNFPKRDEGLAEVVRKCFVPRGPDRYFVEIDYSGAEVRANASITHDPVLVGSVTKGVDFHKRTASMAYILSEDEVTKQLRQSVKGLFTFAAFYGSYWVSIARSLWEQIIYGDLTLKDGTPLREHLRRQGITGLGDVTNPVKGTYYYHIKKTEEWFWGDLFKVYAQWKNQAWSDYKECGYINLPTGFRCAGVFTRNNVTNYSAQGGAAHCLLWSLCVLNHAIKKRGYDALVCSQIHDSIVLDVQKDYLDKTILLAREIMTVKLRQAMKWIAVPMEVEPDVAPMGKSWFEAKAYEIKED